MKNSGYLIITLVFVIIIMFFGSHAPNDNLTQYRNCIADGNSLEACAHFLTDK